MISAVLPLIMGQGVAVLVTWRSEAAQKLRALAMTDGLTGLLDQRGPAHGVPRNEGVFAAQPQVHARFC